MDAPEPIEAASLDELRSLQLDRLKSSLRRAWDHLPPMRAKLEAAGVHPDDLRSLDDLARFPFTVKDDLRAAYPFGMFAVPMAEIVRIHASSGTTGKPTVVGYTKGDIDTWSDLMARSIRAAGGSSADIVHNAYGYGLFTGGLGFHYGAERLGAAVVPVSGGATERQVRLIADFRPTIITATPSYLLTIADEFDRQGLDPRASSLRLAICGAEPWSDAMRDEIEARLGLAAIEPLRPVGDDGAGRRQRVCRHPRRPDAVGGSLLPRDHRPGDRRRAPRRRGGRTGAHAAHPRGDAAHPLPHPRPHAAASRAPVAPCAGSSGSRDAATTC